MTPFSRALVSSEEADLVRVRIRVRDRVRVRVTHGLG